MKTLFSCKKTAARCRIYQMLKAQSKRKHLSFHTPGHKIKGFDITELSYSDNLACPRGVIGSAQRDIAEILGASKSFILTDGSTSGVFSMLYAAKLSGVKTIGLIGNAHSSVYNACAALGLDVLTSADGADALFCTSPDYYGNIPDLTALRALCNEREIPLLIDGAHGGHLHFQKDLYAGSFADLWVDGVHKSLPALTQGAVVSAGSERYGEWLEKAVTLFRTTSPSYPIMASVEYAVKYPENTRLETLVRAYGHSRVRVGKDWTKMLARFGKNAFSAHKYLENQGVWAEFCDGNEICFYLSPATKIKSFRRLCKVLEKAFALFPYEEENMPERIPAPLVLLQTDTEQVTLANAVGRVAAVDCGMFPPCTALICRGERITQEKITLLLSADNVFGLRNGKIAVYKEEKV